MTLSVSDCSQKKISFPSFIKSVTSAKKKPNSSSFSFIKICVLINALNIGLIVLFMTKSDQMQIVCGRALRRGWKQCFNYPGNLLSGGQTVTTICAAVTACLTVTCQLTGGGGCVDQSKAPWTMWFSSSVTRIHLALDGCWPT